MSKEGNQEMSLIVYKENMDLVMSSDRGSHESKGASGE